MTEGESAEGHRHKQVDHRGPPAGESNAKRRLSGRARPAERLGVEMSKNWTPDRRPAPFEARVKADSMTPASQRKLVASFRLCRLRAQAPRFRHGFALVGEAMSS